MADHKKILIIGCGYRGKRLAQRLASAGYQVRGLTRSAEHPKTLESAGIEPVICAGLPLIILRPSSIYRPEGVINKKIREGTYVLTSDPEKLMNHIYVEDFLDILVHAVARGRLGEAYNVSDDEPERGVDYVNTIAE